jgi:hypothetical protein
MEDFISEAVLFRLDSPEFAAIFAESDEDSIKLKAALDTQQLKKQKLDELIDGYYGENPDDLSREQFMRAKASGEAALKNAEREVEKYSTKRAVVGIPIGQTIREAWDHNTDIGWRRKIVGLLVDKIIVHPGGGKPRYKRWRFDVEQIEIQWKV